MWTCADGREVLFDRYYEPLYQRYPGRAPTPVDPWERVQWDSQIWFYGDGAPELAKLKASRKALEDWGVLDQAMGAAEQLEKDSRVH